MSGINRRKCCCGEPVQYRRGRFCGDDSLVSLYLEETGAPGDVFVKRRLDQNCYKFPPTPLYTPPLAGSIIDAYSVDDCSDGDCTTCLYCQPPPSGITPPIFLATFSGGSARCVDASVGSFESCSGIEISKPAGFLDGDYTLTRTGSFSCDWIWQGRPGATPVFHQTDHPELGECGGTVFTIGDWYVEIALTFGMFFGKLCALLRAVLVYSRMDPEDPPEGGMEYCAQVIFEDYNIFFPATTVKCDQILSFSDGAFGAVVPFEP